MLCNLKGDVYTMSSTLCGKHSKHPQKYNGTTFPRCGAKGTAR